MRDAILLSGEIRDFSSQTKKYPLKLPIIFSMINDWLVASSIFFSSDTNSRWKIM